MVPSGIRTVVGRHLLRLRQLRLALSGALQAAGQQRGIRERPPGLGTWCGRGARRVFTRPPPPPWGVALVHQSLQEGCHSDEAAGTTLILAGTAVAVAIGHAFWAPFPASGGNPVLDLIAYHDPVLRDRLGELEIPFETKETEAGAGSELMKSVARRVSDGRMLGLIKAWLEMPVIEEDGEGGTRRTNRARKERKGTPQGAPISPLLSNIYMRRFILGWKVLGYARRFGAEIVNYADDFCVLGKAGAAEMLTAVNRVMERLKLPVNAQKTRCLRCPEESLEFLGTSHRLELSSHGQGPLHRYPTEQGERSRHLPPDQRADGLRTHVDGCRGSGGTPEPDDLGLGELLQPRADQPGLRDRGPTRNTAAATVVLAEAQGALGEIRALLRRAAVGPPRPHASWADHQVPSVGEGVISTESRMREIRMSGSTSGGLETDLWETN